LWSILDWTTPGLLGTLRAFRGRYATAIEADHDEAAAARLSRLIGPFVLRRRKTDPGVAPELPRKTETDHPVTLSREQATLYEAFVRETMAAIVDSEGINRRGLVLKLLTGLKQICNHPAQFLKEQGAAAGGRGSGSTVPDGVGPGPGEKASSAVLPHKPARSGHLASGDPGLAAPHGSAGRTAQTRGDLAVGPGNGRSGKLDLLDELLDTIGAEGASTLVFTQYVAMGRLLEKHLAGRGIATLFLHGQTPVAKRQEMVDAFQNGQVPVFLLSLKAAGVGLNLTQASHVVHYDRWWNPAVEEQATDRAYRIGQTQPVQVHRLIAEGTVEERIAETLAVKKDLADRVLANGEAALTELSNAELAELVALR
jgi:SNF2 family DNA or RNA helicase